VFEDARFDLFFDGIRKLHAFVREKLNPVVLIGIMRGGNDDTNVVVVVADETSYAGSGEDSSERDRGTALLEAGGDYRSDMRAGFAGISADESVRRGVIAMQKFGHGAAKCEQSGVVERGSSRDATNAVSTKELSGHSVRGRWGQPIKSLAQRRWRAGERQGRMC